MDLQPEPVTFSFSPQILEERADTDRNKREEDEMKCVSTQIEAVKSSASGDEYECALLAQHSGYNSPSSFCLCLIKPPSNLPSNYSQG